MVFRAGVVIKTSEDATSISPACAKTTKSTIYSFQIEFNRSPRQRFVRLLSDHNTAHPELNFHLRFDPIRI